MKKKNVRSFLRIGIFIFVVLLIGAIVFQKIQYHRTLRLLTALDEHDVVSLQISHLESPVIFRPDDPLVADFLQARKDIQPALAKAGSVVSLKHTWLMEILTKKGNIQMSCYILTRQNEIVFGHFGTFSTTSAFYYGGFKSQQLFKWYQQYHQRWLEASD